MVYYTHRVSVVIAIGGAICSEFFMVSQLCNERQLLKRSVRDLTLQCNTYLQEVKRDSIYLTDIGPSFRTFKFFGSLVDRVKLLSREVVNEYKVMASV